MKVVNGEWIIDSKERGTNKVTSWTIYMDGLRISVHRWLNVPNKWFVSCASINLERRELESTNDENAKIEGVTVVARETKALWESCVKLAHRLNFGVK